MWDHYVLDCTLDTETEGLYCFIPAEFDENGNLTELVVGMNYLSSSPPDHGRFIGVVHADGDEACEAWCEAHHSFSFRSRSATSLSITSLSIIERELPIEKKFSESKRK